ncbi:MAG TPA: cyclase, partial [Acidimicrobiia bacterium]|nr:cyclase [Acidimicrobiia bacterium]
GLVKTRAKGDLKRFKAFIESQGRESGAWRGEVDQNKN